MGLKGAVHAAAGHCLVKIHQVAVKVGAVHAGKLGLSAHGQAAAAAHAGAIDHDGVHGDDALQTVLLAGLYHKFHHDQRSDGDHFIVLVAGGHQILQGGGHNTLGAVAAVVGHHPQFLAAGTELVLQDQKILVAEADHAVDYTALFMRARPPGSAMAQPTPPPTTQTFFRPSVSVARPRGPTKSWTQSPTFSRFSSMVVPPTIWKMISTVPFSRS